jgi:hypothetical protein
VFAASGLTEVGIGVIGGLLVLAIAGAARAGPQLLGKRQAERRDAMSTYERLYGKPANPRTGEPATKGWTTHVDESLEYLGTVTAQTSTEVKHVRREIHEMGERIMEKADAASAAAAEEVIDQMTERQRVQRRDAERDNA